VELLDKPGIAVGVVGGDRRVSLAKIAFQLVQLRTATPLGGGTGGRQVTDADATTIIPRP
jgi:hypothetical protein